MIVLGLNQSVVRSILTLPDLWIERSLDFLDIQDQERLVLPSLIRSVVVEFPRDLLM